MMSRNQTRQTKEERLRNNIIKANGCMLTWLKFGRKAHAEVHHIVMPGKRLGHWYTIPLSPWYHRGIPEPGRTKDDMRAEYGASLTDGKRAFVASHHYTELELWQKLQVALGLDDELPKSKRVPRRINADMDTLCLPGSEHGAHLLGDRQLRAVPGSDGQLGGPGVGLGGALPDEAPVSAGDVHSGDAQ